MQYRNYETVASRQPNPQRKKPFQTQIQHQKLITYFDPFSSPNVFCSRNQTETSKKLESQKVLFEDDQNQSIVLTPLSINQQSNGGLSELKEKSAQVFNKLFNQVPKQKSTVQRCQAANKQNIKKTEEQTYSFNNKMRVPYPETPKFKELLQSPLPKFLKTFGSKMEDLKSQVRKKVAINPIQYDQPPIKDHGYKHFICLAQNFKKSVAISECRAMYKLCLYSQPFDQAVWQWAIKYEQEIGCFYKAYVLTKTSFLFTNNQNIALKYIKLAERCDIAIEETRGIVSYLSGRIEKFSKVYFELAKLEWKCGNIDNAFKIFYFLSKQSQNPMNYVHDIAKFLECYGYVQQAIQLLYSSIERNIKIYNVYSYYLKLVEQIYPHHLHETINYVIEKSNENLPTEVRWKIHIQIAHIYLRFDSDQFAKNYLKQALELAPIASKSKPYLMILKLLKQPPPNVKNSLFIVEVNKHRFLAGDQPIIHPFTQWKHYLHYSLFYLINGSNASRLQLQEAANKWSHAGRLWAEILWMQRADNQQVLTRWTKIVAEVPKSGQVWCEGGRIYLDLGDYKKAQFCFLAAMQLTPQYGDSFIEILKLYLMIGKYKEIKELKKKVLYAEPFYGNVWCYLKAHSKSTVIDVWKCAKHELKSQVYGPAETKCLTALQSYNRIFRKDYKSCEGEREKIMYAYDQLDNNKC